LKIVSRRFLRATRNMLTRLRTKMGLRILAAGVTRSRTIKSIETKPTVKLETDVCRESPRAQTLISGKVNVVGVPSRPVILKD
jgi:hypothetical protein